jgi:hypothetical protein
MRNTPEQDYHNKIILSRLLLDGELRKKIEEIIPEMASRHGIRGCEAKCATVTSLIELTIEQWQEAAGIPDDTRDAKGDFIANRLYDAIQAVLAQAETEFGKASNQ